MVRTKARLQKNNAPSTVFKILADEKRCAAIMLLIRAQEPSTVGDIAQMLSMTHSAASHLLGTLHRHEIVSYRRAGREMRYMLGKTPAARRISRILKAAG